MIVLLLGSCLAFSSDLHWSPEFAVGDFHEFSCTSDSSTVDGTVQISVVEEHGTGYTLAFSFQGEPTVLVAVTRAGVPISILNPEQVARDWRERSSAALLEDPASVANAANMDPTAQDQLELQIQGLTQAPTVADISNYALARAGVFLPPGSSSSSSVSTEFEGLLAHPMSYRGASKANGTGQAVRTGIFYIDLEYQLHTYGTDSLDLTVRTLAMSNPPGTDLRVPALLLAAMTASEARVIQLQRRSGWPKSIDIETTVSNGLTEPIRYTTNCKQI